MRIIIGLIVTLTLCVSSYSQQKLRTGDAAPAFSAASLNGRQFDLNSLRGKVVVVTFWSTRCNICHSEIPKLNQLATRYRGRDVVFLGLTMDNEAKVESYLKRTPFEFSILPNSFGVILQYADRDRQGNMDIGFPAHFVLDQSGTIGLRASGWDKTSDVEAAISKMLASSQNTKEGRDLRSSTPK